MKVKLTLSLALILAINVLSAQIGGWNPKEREKTDETIAAFKDRDTIEWSVGVVDSTGKIVEQYEGVNHRIRDK